MLLIGVFYYLFSSLIALCFIGEYSWSKEPLFAIAGYGILAFNSLAMIFISGYI